VLMYTKKAFDVPVEFCELLRHKSDRGRAACYFWCFGGLTREKALAWRPVSLR
jgi:hypothetical protein